MESHIGAFKTGSVAEFQGFNGYAEVWKKLKVHIACHDQLATGILSNRGYDLFLDCIRINQNLQGNNHAATNHGSDHEASPHPSPYIHRLILIIAKLINLSMAVDAASISSLFP